MPDQGQRARHARRLRKVFGTVLIVVGFLALVTPLTPGGILFFVGLELLGIRIGFWERMKTVWRDVLRSRARRRTVGALIHKQAIAAMEKEIGNVVHFYDKLGVAIIELSAPLKVGDTIKVKRGDSEFEQAVTSMQVEHETVESGKKGDSVGVKVDQPTKEGAVVFKVTA